MIGGQTEVFPAGSERWLRSSFAFAGSGSVLGDWICFGKIAGTEFQLLSGRTAPNCRNTSPGDHEEQKKRLQAHFLLKSFIQGGRSQTGTLRTGRCSMNLGKLNAILLLAGIGLCPGCATDGLKLPFRDTIAARSNNSNPASESSGEEELSPEFREAQKVFKKDPEGALLAWAQWQEDVGEYAEARRRYRELLIAYPENIEAQLGLARIELSCGRVEQAEQILTAVASERPTNMPVRLELGRLYTQQEAWPKAIAAFEAASAIDPENQVCRYELGIAFAQSHRFDQALSHLTYAVGGSAANYNIGYVLHEQGNDAEAVEWFQNALNSHPDPNTAERTRAILAQLSPKNSRDRNSSPATLSPHSSTKGIATLSKQATVDQFEPASLAVPVVRPLSAGRHSSSGSPLPFVATKTSVPEEAEASVMLPPVNPQPAQFGMASRSVQQSPSGETMNSFRTVSHTASNEPVGRSAGSGTSLPQWRATSHPTPVTEVQASSSSPPGWRQRQ